MTIETINVKGNASKALEDHHNRLKTEAKEPVDGLHLNEPKKKCQIIAIYGNCLLYTSPSPRDRG